MRRGGGGWRPSEDGDSGAEEEGEEGRGGGGEDLKAPSSRCREENWEAACRALVMCDV